MISVHFQGKPFKITLIQAYIPTINAKEAEIKQFYEELQELLEVTHTHTHTHKKSPFRHGRLECKRWKPRNTWNNRQVWPGLQNEPVIIVVQSLTHVWLIATQWTAAGQASLSFTISQSFLKLMSVELVRPSNHLVLCLAFCLFQQ